MYLVGWVSDMCVVWVSDVWVGWVSDLLIDAIVRSPSLAA